MTDEQVKIIADAMNKSSFKDDFLVALTSGLLVLIASAAISYYISKKESVKTKEEMKERIKLESQERLNAQRLFYLEQVEMNDYLKMEYKLEKQKKTTEKYFELLSKDIKLSLVDIPTRYPVIEPYLVEYMNIQNQISNTLDLYGFNKQQNILISALLDEILDVYGSAIDNYDFEYFNDYEELQGVIRNIEELKEEFRQQRMYLYEKMKNTH